MSLKGFPTQQKVVANQPSGNEFVTVQLMDEGLRNGLDTVTKFAFRVGSPSIPRTAQAGTGNPSSAGGTVIQDTSTVAKKGDFVRFITGQASFLEVPVISADTNSITLGARLLPSQLPAAGDTFFVMRYATQRMDDTGAPIVSVTPAPVSFRKDGIATEVQQDTGTPANSVPLPVQLYGVSGQLNVTAQDLNIQSTHAGANPDSMRIGDGTETLLITAAGEALVKDTDVLAKLVQMETAQAKEAKQNSMITELQAIKVIDFATEAKQDSNILAIQDVGAKVDLLRTKVPSSLVPEAYDNIALTYVPSGNGAGEIATVVYKVGTNTIATLTLSYDASNRLSSVVRS